MFLESYILSINGHVLQIKYRSLIFNYMENQQFIECLVYILRKNYSYLLIYFILTAVIQSTDEEIETQIKKLAQGLKTDIRPIRQ